MRGVRGLAPVSDPLSAFPTPSPPLGPVGAMHQEIIALRSRLDELERKVEALETGSEVHANRLDVHDIKSAGLEESLRELRGRVHQMQGDLFRIADACTSNALSLDRATKSAYLQTKSLEIIAGNVQEILARLQTTVVL